MIQTTCVDPAERPVERWDDPERGAITWRTLISGGLTPTDSMTCGIAMLEPGDSFTPHRLSPEKLLFIAGNALHGIEDVEAPVRFFYCFACDSFDQIAYRFAKEPACLILL